MIPRIKFGILAVLFLVMTSVTHAEVVREFDADYRILSTGEVQVVETITYDFEGETRHGIFRTILNKHPQQASAWYKKRTIAVVVKNVTQNGLNVPFDVDYSGGEVTIKIGDAAVNVSGVKVYTVTYTLEGALSYGDAGAEFYYNVTGNNWEVPIEVASANVSGDAVVGNYYCYQGPAGSTESCTNSLRSSTGVSFVANGLAAGSGLTIATELDASRVAAVVNEQTTWLLFGYGLAALWVVVVSIYAYRFRYQHYTKRTVIAQYEPYKNYLPMYTGYLFDTMLDPKDITAGILYLAQQGFIKITKTSKKVLLIIPTTDYTITLLRPLAEIPSQFLTKVSELLFNSSTEVGTAVEISTLAKERTKNAARIMYLKRDLQADLQKHGFLESTYARTLKLGGVVLGGLLVVFAGFLFVHNGFILVLVVSGVTALIGVTMLLPRKTALWFEARNHTEGFKLFLSVTDKERFDFHNAPEKSPELFMQYLPYAVALGVEEKWAKVFADITIPQPDWYDGGTITAFNAGALTADLGAFSSALATTSGVSGSSGGGSSGGGGGGGGGGSW